MRALSCAAGIAEALLRERAALHLHLVRGLPGARDDLADAAHRLRVRADHRERADVVQDVLGGNRFLADAALGKRDVFRDAGVEVMAHHQHVQMLVERVDGVGPRRVGRRRQHVRLAAHLDDVRRVAAAGAFGVIGVDHAALERLDRGFDEAGLVQRVGVDRDLRVGPVGRGQCGVDRSGRGAPVLVELQPDRAGLDLLQQRRLPATHCPCRGSRGSSGTRRPPAACVPCAMGRA